MQPQGLDQTQSEFVYILFVKMSGRSPYGCQFHRTAYKQKISLRKCLLSRNEQDTSPADRSNVPPLELLSDPKHSLRLDC